MTPLKASFGKIALAGLVDAGFVMGAVAILFRYLPGTASAALQAALAPAGWVIVSLVIYRFLMILFFQATFGMMIFKMVFLDGEGEPLDIREKILAAVFVLYRGVDYYQAPERLS